MTVPGARTGFLPDADRPMILGEYPYYRAGPDRWRDNLLALADAGIDVVTCYLPWRFHETSPRSYDFTGRSGPQRDVLRLLRLISGAGLGALLKPGPFVHAEVQFGGLPDRVSPTRDPSFTAVLAADGRPATSGGLALPSPFCPRWRSEAGHWLGAVASQVLTPALRPEGPLLAVQLGNEGIYSDANLAAGTHDFSAPALRAFADHLRGEHPALAERALAEPPVAWPAPIRALWAEWSGEALLDHYLTLAGAWPADVRGLITVNLPLPGLDGPAGAGSAWLLRTAPLHRTGFALGYTSWVGNATRSLRVCARHWLGARALRASNVEENWGFTWTDPAFARPATPLFHALLALALGSRSCSVYTACRTHTWGPEIDLDPGGLRGEGRDPADYGPPYCPGAPLAEDGSEGPTITALHALRDALRRHGPSLDGLRYAAEVAFVLPTGTFRADAWPAGAPAGDLSTGDRATGGRTAAPGSLLETVLQRATDLSVSHQYLVDVLTGSTAEAGLSIPVWVVLDDGTAPPGPGRAGHLDRLIAERRRSGLAVIVLGGAGGAGTTALPVTSTTDALLALLPPPRYAGPDTDPALVLIHEDAAGEPRALFAFNPGERAVVVRRRVRAVAVEIELPAGAGAWLHREGTAFAPALATADLEDPATARHEITSPDTEAWILS